MKKRIITYSAIAILSLAFISSFVFFFTRNREDTGLEGTSGLESGYDSPHSPSDTNDPEDTHNGAYNIDDISDTPQVTVVPSRHFEENALAVGTIFLETDRPVAYFDHTITHEAPGFATIVDAWGDIIFSGEFDRLRGRGNSTWNLPKRPYNLRFPEPQSLFGMNPARTFALLANAQDETMLRNAILLDLADAIGLPYSSKSVFVELYINGEYRGLYQLTERIIIHRNQRINDIGDLNRSTSLLNERPLHEYPPFDYGDMWGFRIPNNPADITGPFLLEGYWKHEESGFITRIGSNISIVSPQFASYEQVAYISSFFQGMEDAVSSPTGFNQYGRHFTEYINLESAAKIFLIQEFSKNHDGASSSIWFWKASDTDGDGLLHFGPAWDFDIALANAGFWGPNDGSYTYIDLSDPEGWWIPFSQNSPNRHSIYAELWQHEEFKDAVVEAWETFSFAINILLGNQEPPPGFRLRSIEEYSNAIRAAALRNYEMWEVLAHGGNRDARMENGFDYGIAHLTRFIAGRYEFMSREGFEDLHRIFRAND